MMVDEQIFGLRINDSDSMGLLVITSGTVWLYCLLSSLTTHYACYIKSFIFRITVQNQHDLIFYVLPQCTETYLCITVVISELLVSQSPTLVQTEISVEVLDGSS